MTTVLAPRDLRGLPRLPLEALDEIRLDAGAHRDRSNGLCLMEVVAWVAGPMCVDPVFRYALQQYNDTVAPEDRDRLLKPLVPLLLNTNRGSLLTRERRERSLAYLIHTVVPGFYDLVPLYRPFAARLRAFTIAPDSTIDEQVLNEASGKVLVVNETIGDDRVGLAYSLHPNTINHAVQWSGLNALTDMVPDHLLSDELYGLHHLAKMAIWRAVTDGVDIMPTVRELQMTFLAFIRSLAEMRGVSRIPA